VEKENKDIPVIGIGMIGYGDMGMAHSNGYRQMPYIFWPPPAIPKLLTLCGRNESKVREAARRFGYQGYCLDWKELVKNPDIQVFVNVGPNNIHMEPCIEAARNGKHVVCEKPLARNKEEAKKMLDTVKKAKVRHICNFSNRMIPALALAKKMLIEEDFGQIYHFRVNYLMDYYTYPEMPFSWRMMKDIAGSGITADLSSHSIDLARWLCGEPISVTAAIKTFVGERTLPGKPASKAKVDTDDYSMAILEFDNGAVGYLESSAVATGKRAFIGVELNAENGSIYWNFEDMCHLNIYYRNEKNKLTKGFHKISVTQDYHPYYKAWLPFEEIPMGYNATFVHTAFHILDAAVNNTSLEPMVATFEDGYKASVIGDAILKSSETGKKEYISY